MSSITQKCSVEGCEKKYKAKGYCSMHYARMLRHGDASADTPPKRANYNGQLCRYDSCEKSAASRGYCEKHYRRLQRHGDVGYNFFKNYGINDSDSSTYSSWVHMIYRCYNEKSDYYSHYGGRGIWVCDRWRFGDNGKQPYLCFLEDMGEKPTPKHEIDRKDSNGNYEPSNCRWATSSVQKHNRGKQSTNTSGYTGVSWNRGMSKWYAQSMIQYQHTSIGYYPTAIEAAKAYDRWVIANRDEYATTNFPREDYLQ